VLWSVSTGGRDFIGKMARDKPEKGTVIDEAIQNASNHPKSSFPKIRVNAGRNVA